MIKICYRCKESRSIEFFSKCKISKDGLNSYCKQCNSEVAKKYREDSKVRARIKETCVIRAAKVKEYNKEYYLNRTKDLRKSSPRKYLDTMLRRVYGITLDQYDEMLNQQHDSCAICGTHQSSLKNRLVVDHCHETDKVRKLLCYPCNTALGLVKEDTDILETMIRYLESFKKEE